MDGAHKLLEEMSNKGCSPDAVSYTTIRSCMCKLGRVKEAREVSVRFTPILPVYNALVNGLFRESNFEEAFQLLDEMMNKSIDPNVITYTTIINALSDAGNPHLNLAVLAHTSYEALDVWDRMISEGIWPNAVSYNTYNTLIHGLCSIGNVGKAVAVSNEMERSGCSLNNMVMENCPPNTVTLNTFFKSLWGSERVDLAIKLLDLMNEYGCLPNIMRSNEILDGLFGENNFTEAFGVFKEMEEGGIELNFVTYNSIIYVFCYAGMLEEAMKFVGKMLVRGIKPDAFTFNILINGNCRTGKIETAIQLLDAMSAEGWCPDIISYTSLICGICECIGLEQVSVYLHRMGNEGIFPNVATWNFLVRFLFSKVGFSAAVDFLDNVLQDQKIVSVNPM
ncbi:pentatricopeptide repeat (PPR) superfamily protein [Actinidia rufa]|uniref:Pentatricopeptide repeat (PPR) superfamily protein n=1 Tax=Actinidia rufa TaxID=165716 RepID=A0A7J0DID0_9ERIC|nr:pentatricopeptide repeat (PPR) superfamily protein [Actinidia rufa]